VRLQAWVRVEALLSWYWVHIASFTLASPFAVEDLSLVSFSEEEDKAESY
jgi:hypothetical protein